MLSFRSPGNGTVLSNFFQKSMLLIFSTNFENFETPSFVFVELAGGFVCLIVSRLKAAQSCRRPKDSPPNT